MSEPAIDWEDCKYSDISASMALNIVERHVGDPETLDAIKSDIHSHASGMMMARGARRYGLR